MHGAQRIDLGLGGLLILIERRLRVALLQLCQDAYRTERVQVKLRRWSILMKSAEAFWRWCHNDDCNSVRMTYAHMQQVAAQTFMHASAGF